VLKEITDQNNRLAFVIDTLQGMAVDLNVVASVEGHAGGRTVAGILDNGLDGFL
jgi:hypothetical protein